MQDVPGLVRSARLAARLSVRGLAARAGVAFSTVARVEAGRMDPTVGMLVRLLAAAGRDLEVAARPAGWPELADLADAWSQDQGDLRLDWTRLRVFVDSLGSHPERAGFVIARRPPASGSPVLDALLAGMAEKVADDAGLARPAWTSMVPPLDVEWCSGGTPRMVDRARMLTPPQLVARRLVIDADSLWRTRERVSA